MQFQRSDIYASNHFFNLRQIHMLTKSDNLRGTKTSCRNTVEKEYYNKREQNNKILLKFQDLNL